MPFMPLPLVAQEAGGPPPGEMRTIRLCDREVLLVNLGDRYYAVDDTCTHDECSLGEGELEDCIVECPCHGATFDVRTGEALTLPATRPLRVYPVRTGPDGATWVELPD
jgi:3-phenylpropionate/trans-cinnamate dioxygenase ferredoxin subunit